MKKSLISCETKITNFFPALKAGIAKELINEYNFTQTDTAQKLSVTQAAVSKYLNGKYSKKIKNFEKNGIVETATKKIAFSIAKERIGKRDIEYLFCQYCRELLSLGG